MLIEISSLVEYFNDRDNDYVSYDPVCSIGAKLVNGEVWYECWHLPSDTLKSNYDYTSRDLKDVLEWCNVNLKTNYIYY